MKKQGFTLIELTGVMVVIALLLLFTLPRIIQNMNDAKENEYKRMIEDLKIATETYIETHRDEYNELNTVGGTVFISINDLIKAKLVRKDLINPRTNSVIDPNYTMSITKSSDGTLGYEYIEGNGSLDAYVSDNLKLMYDGATAPVSNTWTDVSPNSFNGTMSGFNNTAMSGWQGKYIAFDGTDDKITTTTSVSGDFSIEFSYHKDATTKIAGSYVGLYSCNTWSTTAPDPAIVFDLLVAANNSRTLYMRFSVPPVGETPNSTSSININEANYPTNNLTVTFVKTSTKIQLYINGSAGGSLPFESFVSRFNPTTLNLAIGSKQTDSYAVLKANNYRIYTKALTAQEVADNYKVDKARYGE